MTTAGVHGTLSEALGAIPRDDAWAVAAAEALLSAAHAARASDLHLHGRRGPLHVLLRCDGQLRSAGEVPAQFADQLVARFKVLARLPAFVRHEPQDGRIEWRANGSADPLLLRVSFLPALHGESVVVRFPEHASEEIPLGSLSPDAAPLKALRAQLAAPEGLLLLTGPSSSGKTTTLYALLRELTGVRSGHAHIVTIEDPIERDLGFGTQVQVNEPQGLTFERALRAALRQDPNVLMIGEIRDPETARIASQAGMTGHLVLSTIHAGRAARVPSRLLSLGVDRYLAASALLAAAAQRLVQVLCRSCRRREGEFWGAAGCDACGGTGTAGRTAAIEVAPATEAVREVILTGGSSAALAEAMRTALGAGLTESLERFAREGIIAEAEWRRTAGTFEPGE